MAQPREITADEAAASTARMSSWCVNQMSQGYQNALSLSSGLDQRFDNPLMRVLGLSYTVKSAIMIAGALKDVETGSVVGIMHDDSKSFGQKVKDIAGHIHDNFSHEATVAGTMKMVKEPSIIALSVAIGTINPLLGLAAYYGTSTRLKHFLATEAGHHLEAKVAHGIHAASHFVKALFGTCKGQNPVVEATIQMKEKMDAAMKKAEHGHGHQGHGHHGNKTSFMGDLKAVGKGIIDPVKTSQDFYNVIKRDAGIIYKKIVDTTMKAALPALSRFAVEQVKNTIASLPLPESLPVEKKPRIIKDTSHKGPKK